MGRDVARDVSHDSHVVVLRNPTERQGGVDVQDVRLFEHQQLLGSQQAIAAERRDRPHWPQWDADDLDGTDAQLGSNFIDPLRD